MGIAISELLPEQRNQKYKIFEKLAEFGLPLLQKHIRETGSIIFWERILRPRIYLYEGEDTLDVRLIKELPEFTQENYRWQKSKCLIDIGFNSKDRSTVSKLLSEFSCGIFATSSFKTANPGADWKFF